MWQRQKLLLPQQTTDEASLLSFAGSTGYRQQAL